MKKVFLILIVLFVSALPFCYGDMSEQLDIKKMDHKEALLFYFATSKEKIDEKTYEDYIKGYYNSIYEKYNEDEFEKNEQFNKIKSELDDEVKNFDTTSLYTISTKIDIGEYDFYFKGFNCKALDKTSYFAFRELDKQEFFEYMKTATVFFNNSDDFNFLQYPEEKAKTFIVNTFKN